MAELKHTRQELTQLQALPLSRKIEQTKERLEEWIWAWHRFHIRNNNTGNTRYVTWNINKGSAPPLRANEEVVKIEDKWVYLSFSGGKDSAVIHHILNSMGYYTPEAIPRVFVNTGLELSEVQSFAKSIANVVLRPQMRFDEVLKKYGYPVISKDVSLQIRSARSGAQWPFKYLHGTRLNPNGGGSIYNTTKYEPLLRADFRISDKCCDIMKEAPLNNYRAQTGRMPIVGTMASESRRRSTSWLISGCNAFDSRSAGRRSAPLAFWTEQDILQYIKDFNVEISSAYGEIVYNDKKKRLETTGRFRTGCAFCAFGAHIRNDNRFLELKKRSPKQWEYCIGGGEYDEEGYWIPNKEGLGLGHVFDELNKLYGDGFINYRK